MSRKRYTHVTREKIKEMKLLVKEGRSTRYIGDKLGISAQSVSLAMRREGVKIEKSKPYKLTEEKKEEIKRVYEEGVHKTYQSISKEVGVSRGYVSAILKSYGLGKERKGYTRRKKQEV